MVYYYSLRNVRTDSADIIGTFAPLNIGDVINWGKDDESEDGIARWRVVRLVSTEQV